MTNDDYWQEFERSGRIGDYLKYALGSERRAEQPQNEPASGGAAVQPLTGT